MTAIILSVLVVALCGTTFGQVYYERNCPPRDAVQNFQLDYYAGIWHEQYRYPVEFFDADCVQHSYNLEDENSFTINMTFLFLPNTFPRGYHGHAEFRDPEMNPREGVFKVHFDEIGFGNDNYKILFTDYDFAAIMWNCIDLDVGLSAEIAFVLTRKSEIVGGEEGLLLYLIDTFLDAGELRKTELDSEICTSSVQ